MDCALRVRDLHRVRPDDIVEIRCRTAAGPVPRLWEPLAAKHAPQNGYAAKFSLPYLLAVILSRGRASLAEFEDDVVRDPAILALASRVGYELDPTIDYPRQFVGHVRVRLRDGRVVEERQDHPRGGPDSPMTRDEIEWKFRGNASLVMSTDQASRVVRTVDALVGEPNLGSLTESLTL
jgi:2-methylcitrate dehydratase PrpD